MKERISPASFELIVRFESGDRPYYEKRLKHPTWPGGRSGVTIGFGWDFGYEENLDRDWGPYLSTEKLNRLARCLGKIGSQGAQAVSGVRDIEIEWDWACVEFNENTLPREIRKTLNTFPGSADLLTADAFGAMVSLIFNRGTDLQGDRRREMLRIYTLIGAGKTYDKKQLHLEIAKQLRSMKRLWSDDKESDGDLFDRREAEAELVERSVA